MRIDRCDVLYPELSYVVTGCAQRVHRALGPGFPERVYQVALCRELAKAGIHFEAEKEHQVHYDGVLCGSFRADTVVEGAIILELEALDRLTSDHLAQALTYLKASGLRLALPINFGRRSLETQRVVL